MSVHVNQDRYLFIHTEIHRLTHISMGCGWKMLPSRNHSSIFQGSKGLDPGHCTFVAVKATQFLGPVVTHFWCMCNWTLFQLVNQALGYLLVPISSIVEICLRSLLVASLRFLWRDHWQKSRHKACRRKMAKPKRGGSWRLEALERDYFRWGHHQWMPLGKRSNVKPQTPPLVPSISSVQGETWTTER